MMKKKTITLILILISLGMFSQTKTIIHKTDQPNYDYSNDLIADLNNFEIIQFESEKTYNFGKSITLKGKIKEITTTANTRAILQYSKNINSLFRFNKKVNFTNIVFDVNNKATESYPPIVNLNNVPGIKFENCRFQNSNGSGITAGGGTGYHCNGLQLINCEFHNIKGRTVVQLIDRRTSPRDKDGNITTTTKGNPVLEFTQGVLIKDCTFSGKYNVGIRMDNGNDFYKLAGETGVRRYVESTKVNLMITGSTFEQAVAWPIGTVQASNITAIGNTFYGGGSGNNPKPTATVFHVEQFCRNFVVKDNTFNISHGYVFQLGANEGYKRYNEDPIILYDNKGGRAHSSAVGSNSCPKSSNPLHCKRTIHQYGPRDFTISNNTFISTSNNVRTAIQLKDTENFKIGEVGDGNLKNTYQGPFSQKIVAIQKGDLGNKNIVINDNITKCDIKAKGDIWFDNLKSNIKLNGANFIDNDCSGETPPSLSSQKIETNPDFTFSPNPASTFLTFKTSNDNYIVDIYNIVGSPVKTFKIDKNSTSQVAIDEIKNGTYFLKYKNEKGTYNSVEKLIVN